MDENAKKIQREIAKDKIQVILSSIALAILIIMELYIMINIKGNFMAMAIGVLLTIVALFFLISALMDMSLKSKQVEQEKYDEIYNAQKASYLVIKKSFDEMEQRLRVIEENSALPAEDIINAQKAVAKVTISRSKENTDALMNSNDELINQLVSIQEKLESNNSQILEKQQTLLKETNLDIQQKIAQLTTQISSIEGRIQGGIPVMAQAPVQMVAPEPQVQTFAELEVAPTEELMPDLDAISEDVPSEAVTDDISLDTGIDEVGLDLDAVSEEPASEEVAEEEVEDLGLDLEAVSEEPVAEEVVEEAVEDLGLDLDAVSEEPVAEEVAEEAVEDLGLDLDAVSEEPIAEEAIEEPTEDLGLDLDAVSEEPAAEEVIEEPAEDLGLDLDAVAEEPVAEEVVEEPVAEEQASDDIGAGLDALLDEISLDPVETEIEAKEAAAEEANIEVAEEPLVAEEPKEEAITIPDVGIDLSDPNKVMSPEEIEKLFASL